MLLKKGENMIIQTGTNTALKSNTTFARLKQKGNSKSKTDELELLGQIGINAREGGPIQYLSQLSTRNHSHFQDQNRRIIAHRRSARITVLDHKGVDINAILKGQGQLPSDVVVLQSRPHSKDKLRVTLTRNNVFDALKALMQRTRK